MYIQRIIHVPALGKNADLRTALEERNKAGSSSAPHARSVSMFSPEPTFIDSIRFENLAAIEAYQDRQRSEPNIQAQLQKITQCLARPQAVFLYEELSGTPINTPPKFVIRNRLAPAPGRE